MDAKTSSSEEKERKTSRSTKSFLGVILRICLVLLTGGVIGAVVYFSAVGWVPYLEQRIFQPISRNRDQLQEVAATQQALEDQLTALKENQEEVLLSSDQYLTSVEREIDRLESEIETVTAHSFTQVPALLATLSANQQASEIQLSALATAQMEYPDDGFESEFVIILALLSRANQFLLHDNYGLAEDQLAAAQQILLEMEEQLDDWQRVQALELINMIEGVRTDLPGQPALASGKLELSWQLALLGFQAHPDTDLQGTSMPTQGESSTPTPTPK
ncbi:MAG: hypothetical protein DRI46_02895 [Chloroflexi bacterium]|nr:MAG: hypothetical protein DRI46_02895 [Chloroflexota bacterium]